VTDAGRTLFLQAANVVGRFHVYLAGAPSGDGFDAIRAVLSYSGTASLMRNMPSKTLARRQGKSMALTYCAEGGHQLSDTASACPHRGAPPHACDIACNLKNTLQDKQ